jgi:pimeloyl-ACP methyl ester carboxylesterase
VTEALVNTRRLPGAGIAMVADVWGDATAPPVVLLHGGGQTRHAWGETGPSLAARGWQVLAPDLRGHGESDWSPDGSYTIDGFADDVRALVGALDRPPVLVGASLGGLSALLAVGEAPRAPARALVLVDVAHRAAPAGVSRILEFMGGRPDGFASLEEAAAAVAAYLPDRAAPDSLSGLRRNLRARDGRWVWHWDPRLLGRLDRSIVRAGAPSRYLAAIRAVSAPILLLRGVLSDVLSEDIAEELCALVPSIERVDVAGAGHMVAGDRNDRFLAALLPFLVRLAPPAAT